MSQKRASPSFFRSPKRFHSLWLGLPLTFLASLPSARAEEPDGVLVGMPDPSIIKAPDGKGYYAYATGRGLPFYHSADLVHWRRAGRVFDGRVPPWAARAIPGTRGIWAPHIERFGDRYYLYYSVSTFGKQRSVIGLAVNRELDPERPGYGWEDRGEVISSKPGDSFNAIDPAAFVDDDGRAYLFWGSFWSGLKAIELDPSTGKPKPGAARVDIADRRQPPNAIEAAFVVEREGYYYLFASFDSCCDGARSTYHMVIGRSESVLGPYIDARGRPMMEGGATLIVAGDQRWRGPGHNSVLFDGERSWLVHHTYDVKHLEHHRIIQVRPLYWLESGWPVAGEPLAVTIDRPVRKPDRAALTGKWRLVLDYDEKSARTIELLPGGELKPGANGSSWRLEGQRLTIEWKGDAAPGGARRFDLIVESTGRSFIGRDDRFTVIGGHRIEE